MISQCPIHGEYGNADSPRSTCTACRKDATHAYLAMRDAHALAERWSDAGIPERMANRSLANFRATDAGMKRAKALVTKWLESAEPEALLLTGPAGSGKTHLAAACIFDLVSRGMTARYVSVPDLIDQVRSTFGERGASENATAQLRRVGLLVLDEVGAHAGSPWEQNLLSALIDFRYRHQLATVFATNLAPGALASFIGERGADRIAEYALTVALSGPSYRPRVADDAALRNAPPNVSDPPSSIEVTIHRDGQPTTERATTWGATPSWIDRSVQREA